jgi:L-cysteine desulfidase
MEPLTKLIKDDMKPALGVTEPGAIAFAVSTARSYLKGSIESVEVRLNSGIYKNAFTCGIPNSSHLGNVFSAALGAVAGDPSKGLESLSDVTDEDNREAEKLVEEGRVKVSMSEISSRIHIEADVRTSRGEASVTIWDQHTNITRIVVNGSVVMQKDADGEDESEEKADIHSYSLDDIMQYVDTVPADEISFIGDAFTMNMELFEEGMRSDRTTYAHYLFRKNDSRTISEDELSTAQLLCGGAIEARVLGLDKPAMSITGSGAHGIIATMPLYAVCRIRGLDQEELNRATALSYLICMYIKEYSGRLSAFCGCAIAAGSGMACALVYLDGGGTDAIKRCLNNMASSITGMICDGGNHGCTMKGIVAVDAAFRSKDLAMNGVCIEDEHGINGSTAEETMRNMGLIASPGMVKTEETIVQIMQDKQQ